MLLLYLSLQKEMVKRRYDAYNGMTSSNFSVIATEYTPLFKWLGSRTLGSLKTRHEFLLANEKEVQSIDMMSLDDQETMISEDEIEDW